MATRKKRTIEDNARVFITNIEKGHENDPRYNIYEIVAGYKPTDIGMRQVSDEIRDSYDVILERGYISEFWHNKYDSFLPESVIESDYYIKMTNDKRMAKSTSPIHPANKLVTTGLTNSEKRRTFTEEQYYLILADKSANPPMKKSVCARKYLKKDGTCISESTVTAIWSGEIISLAEKKKKAELALIEIKEKSKNDSEKTADQLDLELLEIEQSENKKKIQLLNLELKQDENKKKIIAKKKAIKKAV